MEDRDIRLRNLTYGLFVDLGRAPTAAEVAVASGSTLNDVLAGWLRLHEQHAIVLDDTRMAIRMANPFSNVPTDYRVDAGDRLWYANCAWDAFGVCVALRADGRIKTSCPDCADPIAVDVTRGEPSDTTLLFHCLVPARSWWDDIVHT